MNNEEAKFIMQGYRPDGADATDAALRSALEQVQRDPALHEWFARQQAFDAAISSKLNEIQAPAGLREAILAGGRVTAPLRFRWRAPVILAVAAGVAVMVVTALTLWPRRAEAAPALAEYVLADAAREGTHKGGHGTDALQAMLGDPANRLSRGLPISFDALRRDGCRTLAYEGREVLEVCFNRNGVWFHAYIGRRADFPDVPAAASFSEKSAFAMASWADSEHVYMVASRAGEMALRSLL